ncbi:MAG: hypothetical protein H7177_01080 [Rhizobacter sp.]|nr:hypothetical protein [Bacteriovorax sp.]
MKNFLAIVMALGLTTVALADDIEQNALKSLISSSNEITLEGDVHSTETVKEIYENAVNAGAKIENVCTIMAAAKIAKCTLWITYPVGESALEYVVNLPGTSLASTAVNVSRGD